MYVTLSFCKFFNDLQSTFTYLKLVKLNYKENATLLSVSKERSQKANCVALLYSNANIYKAFIFIFSS